MTGVTLWVTFGPVTAVTETPRTPVSLARDWHPRIMLAYTSAADQSNVFYLTGMSNACMVVDALRRAGTDLTRQGLMQAAASLSKSSNPFLLPGVVARTTATDHFPITQMEIGHFHQGVFQLSGTLEDTRSTVLALIGP